MEFDKDDKAILIGLSLLIIFTNIGDGFWNNGSGSPNPKFVPADNRQQYEIDNPTIVPTAVTPDVKPTHKVLFDIDVDTKALLYKKGDCTILIKDYTEIGNKDAEVGNCTYSDWEDLKNRLPHQPKPTVVPTTIPTTVPTVVPEPAAIHTKPFDNVWDFVRYVQSNWKYVYKKKGDIVQKPEDSYELLSGDCQDFSSMIAYYLQEVYGYDTVIVRVDLPEGPHLAAFVSTDDTVWNDCTSYPTVFDKKGKKYYPVDWKICPGWVWTSSGTLTLYEWNDIAGHIHG